MVQLREHSYLDLNEVVSVYFYADKYQIRDMKQQVEECVGNICGEVLPDDLIESLETVEKFGFSDLKTAIDKDKVELCIEDDNALQFYNICQRFNMDTLKKDVVSAMSKMDYDVSWPPELLLEIAERNRKDLSKMESKANQEHGKASKRRITDSDSSDSVSDT